MHKITDLDLSKKKLTKKGRIVLFKVDAIFAGIAFVSLVLTWLFCMIANFFFKDDVLMWTIFVSISTSSFVSGAVYLGTFIEERKRQVFVVNQIFADRVLQWVNVDNDFRGLEINMFEARSLLHPVNPMVSMEDFGYSRFEEKPEFEEFGSIYKKFGWRWFKITLVWQDDRYSLVFLPSGVKRKSIK